MRLFPQINDVGRSTVGPGRVDTPWPHGVGGITFTLDRQAKPIIVP